MTGRSRGSSAGARRTRFRPGWLPVVALIVGVVALAAFVLLRPPGDAPSATPGASASGRGFTQPPTGGLQIGDVASLADDAVARVNGIEPDVTLAPGLPAPEAGMRLDRVDVEICAGRVELFVDAAFWNGLGRDQRVHSAHLGVRSFFTLTMASGSCQRGRVDVAVPEGIELESVILMDTSQTTVGRWSVEGEAREPEPLTPAVRRDAAAPGTRVDLLVGGSATVHAVQPEVEASPGGASPGGGSVRVDAELCAGREPLPTSPRHWFLQLTDQRLVVANAEAPSTQQDTLDPEACDRGAIEYSIPRGATPAGVLYAYGGQFEQATWAIEP